MSYVDKVTAAEILSKKLNIPLYDLADIFAEIPTADVKPVVRGEWIKPTPTRIKQYKRICNICDGRAYKIGDTELNFCPSCGADMRSNNAERISEKE